MSTHLDLVDVGDDSAHPSRAGQGPVLVDSHDAAVLEAAYYDLKTLRDVALNQP